MAKEGKRNLIKGRKKKSERYGERRKKKYKKRR